MNWTLAYAVGFHPWEDAIGDPPFAETFSRLLDREEEGREPPYGPALDLGTGSGIWGVELAGRGWQVTGVDIVGKALRHARERIRKAGVEMRLVQGNVAKLRAAGIGSGFRPEPARHASACGGKLPRDLLD
jgi:SAM-dependent methyltransferase